jgi:hypothetical protein
VIRIILHSFGLHYSEVVSTSALIVSFVVLAWQWYVVKSERKRCLVIVQRREDFMNCVEQNGTGLTRFIFFVSVINNSLRTPVIIFGFRLDLPWQEDQFHWLSDPLESGEADGMYAFENVKLHPRNAVLNHRVYGEGRLAPGEVIEGWLLGQAYSPIPESYRNGETFTMKFSVIDQDLKFHSVDCRFMVRKV